MTCPRGNLWRRKLPVFSSAGCCHTGLRAGTRVARLPFSRPNSRNLTFFKVLWHEKMAFGMYIIVWHFLAFFGGVGMKKHCLAFFETYGSVAVVCLELRAFSEDNGPLFSATIPFLKMQAALPSKGKGHNAFLRKTSKTTAHCTVS